MSRRAAARSRSRRAQPKFFTNRLDFVHLSLEEGKVISSVYKTGFKNLTEAEDAVHWLSIGVEVNVLNDRDLCNDIRQQYAALVAASHSGTGQELSDVSAT